METKSIGSIIKVALIAAAIASLLVSAFHFLVTEPVIDRAIALEEQLHDVDHQQAAEGETHEALVSREAQRAGLFLGFLMYGLTWALLISPVYHLSQALIRDWHPSRRGLIAVLLTGWSVAVLPSLKYPANPPGVGDPETIGFRQALYISFIALSALITLIAFAFHRRLSRQNTTRERRGWSLAIIATAYVVGLALAFVAMPASPDEVRMPGDLVSTFRTLSLAGLALFWVTFAGGFAWLLRPARGLERSIGPLTHARITR